MSVDLSGILYTLQAVYTAGESHYIKQFAEEATKYFPHIKIIAFICIYCIKSLKHVAHSSVRRRHIILQERNRYLFYICNMKRLAEEETT